MDWAMVGVASHLHAQVALFIQVSLSHSCWCFAPIGISYGGRWWRPLTQYQPPGPPQEPGPLYRHGILPAALSVAVSGGRSP